MECTNGVCCAQYADGTCNPLPMYRPRGALPRALYNKHLSDIELKKIDKDKVNMYMYIHVCIYIF